MIAGVHLLVPVWLPRIRVVAQGVQVSEMVQRKAIGWGSSSFGGS